MQGVYDQFFYLKYTGGWSFIEAYNLPVGLRKWFVKRLLEQLKLEKEAVESAKSQSRSSKGSQVLTAHNNPKR
jgi:hypothetical protein|tara:strand:- start:225 stop:443 length:219 start_codon:yes stop_codon:yes gene_type:complete